MDQNLVFDYLDCLLFEKGLSENTLMAYQRDISDFVNYWTKNRESDQIESALVQNYLLHLASRLKSSSLMRRKSSLKNFLIFLQQRKNFKIDFLDTLEGGKMEHFLPTVLTPKEVSDCIECAINGRTVSWQQATESDFLNNRFSFRDELMIKMIYALGVRVSELCHLKFRDFDLEDLMVKIMGKGDKTRYLPLPDELNLMISTYQKKIRPLFLKQPHDYFLITQKGSRFSRFGLWKWIKSLSIKAGMTKNISPHTFRHSFATHMVQNGADIRSVQELLGHSNIKTTEKYTHLSTRDLQQTFIQFHPHYRE